MFNVVKNIFKYLKIQDRIGEPPWEYNFLLNLDESEYPKYLAKVFNYKTGEKLPLKFDFKIHNWIIDKNKCKTFNQKIQWIKLNGITDLMRKCTDKVLVRDYVKEKIGSEYLKPVLQICDNFEEINFDKLPNSFVIKCNHGSKWQFIIKNKEELLNTPQLFEHVKRNITGWLEQEFFPWNGFEMQYKGIKPKIIIETYLSENLNKNPREIEIYCFNFEPKIYVNVEYGNHRKICFYNEDFSISDLILHPDGKNDIKKETADDLLKQAVKLSKNLAFGFSPVRVDWIVFNNRLYFNELTFTPYSGFNVFDKKWNLKLGKMIKL